MKNKEKLCPEERNYINIAGILPLILIILAGTCNLLCANSEKGNILSENKHNHPFVIDKRSELWRFIESQPVIDTHEHISSEIEMVNSQADIFDLFTPYIVDNLQSAGMIDTEMELMNNRKADFKERWDIFHKYYPLIRNSTYFLALSRALKVEYQMESVTIEEFRRVSELMMQDFAEEGFMQEFMDRYRIESILTFRGCSMAEASRKYGKNNITLVPRVDNISVREATSLNNISRWASMPVSCLDDILKSIDTLFSVYAANGIKNIKFGSAYYRELNYRPRTREEAEASFAVIMQTPFNIPGKLPNTLSDYHIPLDDYLAAYMISMADKYDMNVIFHVGPFAWNYNYVKYSHSSGLEWLFNTFPNVNFVILHSGYPFFEEAMMLAKYYPNVYLNMAWDHIIERRKSVNIMKSYVEMLPTNKIHAFGGDYFFPQQIIGNLIFTKENIYFAFKELIEEGSMTLEDSKQVIYNWLYANPKAFYY